MFLDQMLMKEGSGAKKGKQNKKRKLSFPFFSSLVRVLIKEARITSGALTTRDHI